MWADLPPSPLATSMPIQTPAYYEFAPDGADPIESMMRLQAIRTFSTSPGGFPVANGMLLVVDGVPFLVVPQSLRQEQSTAVTADVAAPVWSVPEQLDTVKSQLDISVTQLAELFSVTRKTVYDWYEGQSPRNTKSAQINALIEVLGKRSDLDLKRLKGFWNVSLHGGSFRSTLQSDTLSGPELTAALTAKLNELSAEMSTTNRAHLRGATPYTGESTLADIEHHSDSY